MRKSSEFSWGIPALLLAVLLWGTLGVFRRYIGLPSGMLAFARGVLGALFLLILYPICRRRPHFAAIRQNGFKLLLSGVFLALNWIFLFEAYRYSVSVAVVCYYMAPVLVTLAAPFLLGERMTPRKILCVAVAFVGAALVSGIGRGAEGGQIQCVIFALIAAVCYASVTLTTKKMTVIPAKDCTVVQLLVASVFLLPYTLIFERNVTYSMDTVSWIFLFAVGILHTGVAFGLYFFAVGKLPAYTVALCSYLDPVVAIVLSAVFLQESIGWPGIVGAVLVIGAAIAGETDLNRWKHKKEGT